MRVAYRSPVVETREVEVKPEQIALEVSREELLALTAIIGVRSSGFLNTLELFAELRDLVSRLGLTIDYEAVRLKAVKDRDAQARFLVK
jgi:hypothetical protein